MSRTNIDIDDEACAAIMRRYRLFPRHFGRLSVRGVTPSWPATSRSAMRMEVLADARDESHLEARRGLLARAIVLPTESTA